MPEGTLKARLARGRDLLRRRFPHLREQLASAPLAGAGKEVLR
jgi:hypothetical protein